MIVLVLLGLLILISIGLYIRLVVIIWRDDNEVIEDISKTYKGIEQ